MMLFYGVFGSAVCWLTGCNNEWFYKPVIGTNFVERDYAKCVNCGKITRDNGK